MVLRESARSAKRAARSTVHRIESANSVRERDVQNGFHHGTSVMGRSAERVWAFLRRTEYPTSRDT